MAQRVQLLQVHDFSGGINYRDDAFQLATNELADSLNVRILPQGGFERRKTAKNINSVSFAEFAKNLFAYFGNGEVQIVVQIDGDLAYSDDADGTFTNVNIGPDIDGIMRGAVMSRVTAPTETDLYLQRNTEADVLVWDGTSASFLADASGSYNNDLTSPAGGTAPIAKYMVSHLGFMFHGNILEGATITSHATSGGTSYPFRVRWSHPGEPEDYRSTDFIDVGVNDGDPITGLASLGHVLYIFKSKSIWTLSGYDPTTFQLAKMIDTVGAVEQEAIATAPHAIYFFDGMRGVFVIDEGGRLHWLWEKIVPKLNDGTINREALQNVTLGWMDSRLWVGTPWGESETTNTRVFVYDPKLGREGAWYPYEYGNASLTTITIGPMLEWRPDDATAHLFALGDRGGKVLYQLEFDDGADDAFGSFTSFARTAWFNAGAPGVRKRWRRTMYVVDAAADYRLGIKCFTDYATLVAHRTMSVNVTAANEGSGTWGVDTWNSFTWGETPFADQAIKRGAGFGSAYAVQLQFDGPNDLPWGVNAIDFHYLLKRIR